MEGWGVKIVTKLSSFGKEEYPQGEVVGEYTCAVHLPPRLSATPPS